MGGQIRSFAAFFFQRPNGSAAPVPFSAGDVKITLHHAFVIRPSASAEEDDGNKIGVILKDVASESSFLMTFFFYN